jgi:membrane associated rhomboid family serine protease
MSEPPGAEAPRCYRHPDREALVRCTRCERPICPDCMRPASVGFHCPDDVAREAKTVRAPRTSVGARIVQSRPYVTLTLIALNVLVYVITALAPGASFDDPGAGAASGKGLFLRWQLVPYFVKADNRYYELITSAFLHASLLHIASNMLALAFVGPAVESVLGRWRFTALYLLSALGGSAAIYAFGGQFTPTVGASGAIFGLFGACLVLYRRLGLDLQYLVAIVALNFILTFSVHGISKLGHIGGFVTGLVAGVAIGGLPSVRRRVPVRVQAGGLTGLLVLLAVVVGLRTATW